MKYCIICRELKDNSNDEKDVNDGKKDDFNDEHVIPDAIQGYYHIRSVCRKCNSFLGANVDNKLTNHKFIELQRYLLHIKGKSGQIPNPFSGTYHLKDEPTEKVKLEVGPDNIFVPRFIPQFDTTTRSDKVELVLDKRDRHLADDIFNKFLKRKGFSKENLKIEERSETVEKPTIVMELKIDFEQYKLGLLKIAYEFTIDQIEKYYDDPIAIHISKILKTADLEKMKNGVTFFGSGLDKSILKPVNNFIDFENNNHYLVLINIPGNGLICIVNLFNTFSLGILMSNSSDLMSGNLLIGKNDINEHSFEIFDTDKLVRTIYGGTEYSFRFLSPYLTVLEDFQSELNGNSDIFTVNNCIQLFNRNGDIVFKDIEFKLSDPNLKRFSKTTGDMISIEFEIDEELYVKLLPSNKLYCISTVTTIQKRLNRI